MTRPSRAPSSVEGASRRWLLLVHQLPPTPSNIRVRTWRRLQLLGAVPVKQAVYVLPDSPTAREDYEWLKTEIKGAGGDATVFAADSVDAWSDDAIVEAFRHVRQQSYDELSTEIESSLRKLDKTQKRDSHPSPTGRTLDAYRQRLAALERIDFFGSAGRDRAAGLLDSLAARLSPSTRPAAAPAVARSRDGYRQRLWVTRPRSGIDRMSSAWLIRHFIDPAARFAFAADREAVPRDAIPFDMFGVEFSHHEERCTFETLVSTFAIRDAAIDRIAAIVHDLDLKDGRFGAPEATAIGTLIDGLRLVYTADEVLLEEGIKLFEALHRALAHAGRHASPRAAVRPAKRPQRKRSRT